MRALPRETGRPGIGGVTNGLTTACDPRRRRCLVKRSADGPLDTIAAAVARQGPKSVQPAPRSREESRRATKDPAWRYPDYNARSPPTTKNARTNERHGDCLGMIPLVPLDLANKGDHTSLGARSFARLGFRSLCESTPFQ